jgi:hypothetical protein
MNNANKHGLRKGSVPMIKAGTKITFSPDIILFNPTQEEIKLKFNRIKSEPIKLTGYSEDLHWRISRNQ